MMADAEPEATLNISLGAPRARLQGILQRSIDLVSFGLNAAEYSAPPTATAVEPGTIPMPGVAMQFTAAVDRAMTLVEAKEQFKTWVLQCGFRDVVEGLQDFLEEERVLCAALALGPRSRVPAGWTPPFTRESAEGQAFHWMPVERKLERLQNDYGVSLGSELQAVVLAINKARNCLAHRGGIVGPPDFNDPEGLRIRWRLMEVVVKEDAAAEERPLVITEVIEGPATITMRIVAAEKLFRLGERISVAPAEFNSVAITLMGVADELGGGVAEYGRGKGFPIGERQPTRPADTTPRPADAGNGGEA